MTVRYETTRADDRALREADARDRARAPALRLAILDADMHHGQGIQEIFYDRSDVLYVSIHGDPTNFYPAVAGFEDERGRADGEGFNLNLPMPHGSGEGVFFERLETAIDAVADFRADALVRRSASTSTSWTHRRRSPFRPPGLRVWARPYEL